MESLTYKNTSNYVAEKKLKWIELGNRIEQQLYLARTERNVPIYLTKVRIKSADSAYLKTKRKHKRDFSNITDWVGVRVLCLFQQDLIEVHEFILRMLLGKADDRISTARGIPPKINEVIVYNWEKVDKPYVICDSIATALQSNDDVRWDVGDGEEARDFVYSFPTITEFAAQNLSFKLQNKGSGYKSIHYQVDIDGISVEIQLRTLLQDVWGELEHALSYKKGKIHSHIKNSFLLLSRELKAKDMLVGQLRDVSERERSFALFARGKSGPSKWLSYDASLLDKLPKNAMFQEFLSEYFSEFKDDLNQRTTWSVAWCERIAKLLDHGKSCAGELPDEKNPLNYFFDMEHAFLNFCKGEITEAQKTLEEYSRKEEYQNRWVVQYRLGEIHTIDGNIEKSLICFDECESLITRLNPGERDKKGEMYAKQKLANVYWSLGDEYLDIAIEKMNEAAALFPAMEEDGAVTNRDTVILYNNLCYYSLEKYIKYSSGADSSDDKEALKQIHQLKMDLTRFHSQLESFVVAHPDAANANAYDTLAWFAYVKYREAPQSTQPANKTAREWLRDAHDYLQKMSQKSNNSSSPFVSMAIQHEHVQEIMASFDSEFRSKKAHHLLGT